MGWSPADVLSLVVAVMNSGIIEAVVRVVERLMPGARGLEKKEEAMKMVGAQLPARATSILSAAVDAVVGEYNDQGVFGHRGDQVGL